MQFGVGIIEYLVTGSGAMLWLLPSLRVRREDLAAPSATHALVLTRMQGPPWDVTINILALVSAMLVRLARARAGRLSPRKPRPDVVASVSSRRRRSAETGRRSA